MLINFRSSRIKSYDCTVLLFYMRQCSESNAASEIIFTSVFVVVLQNVKESRMRKRFGARQNSKYIIYWHRTEMWYQESQLRIIFISINLMNLLQFPTAARVMRSHYLFCQSMFSLLIIYDQERNHHIGEAEKKRMWMLWLDYQKHLKIEPHICWCKISLSSNNVVLSGRWTDVFSAKGCHDTAEHGFSHPFVQVKYKTAALKALNYHVSSWFKSKLCRYLARQSSDTAACV